MHSVKAIKMMHIDHIYKRYCISCKDEVESECHVLVQCPLYHDIRE